MKRIHNILLFTAAVLPSVQSCQETPPSEEDAFGNVEFVCSVQESVIPETAFSKAGGPQKALPDGLVPEASELHLVITGAEDYSAEYGTVAEFDNPMMKAGEYTAVFSYGDPDSEGPDVAYFGASVDFNVIARKTSVENVTATLANSVFSVVVSQWFADYYPEYEITVETESGYSVTFGSGSTEPETESEPVFVKAGTTLWFSGSAVKTNGAEVSFPKTEIATTETRTWQTLGIDASQAAAGTVEIVLDDSVVTVKEYEIELNPDA